MRTDELIMLGRMLRKRLYSEGGRNDQEQDLLIWRRWLLKLVEDVLKTNFEEVHGLQRAVATN